MNLSNYIKRFFLASADDNDEVDKLLNERIQKTQQIPPDTSHQWQKLSRVINERITIEVQKPIVIFYRKPAFILTVTLVFIAIVGTLIINPFISTKVYETKRGQHCSFLLPDNTEIKLNHTSRLIVHRSIFDKSRKVFLEGEAFFNVRHSDKSFIVTTEVGRVEVLGTTFNIRARDTRMEVAVITGKVRVNNSNGEVIANAGQITQCIKNSPPETPALLPFSQYPGWINGKFVFYRTPLLSVCKEIEAYFDTKIIVNDTDNITITGILDGKSLETTLATLIQLTGKQIRNEAAGYIIY